MRQFSYFLLQLCQLTLLGLEQLLRSSNAFNLIFLLPPLQIIKFPLVDLNELVDIMKLFFDKFKLLVEVRWCIFIALWYFSFIKDFIDCLSKFIELVTILLILEFKCNDHFLIVFFTFPLLSNELPCSIYFLR